MSTWSSAAAAPAREAAMAFQYPEVADPRAGVVPAGPGVAERMEQARAEGRVEGRALAAADYAEALARARDSVAAAVADFARQREHYFQQVEGEVVQLALAIARKILHRESHLDPLALAGMARVTMGQLQAGTVVRVRVPPPQAADWRHYFACQDQEPVEVVEDAAVAGDGCVLETSAGSVELGFTTQLKEIETGLMDLLAARPAGR